MLNLTYAHIPTLKQYKIKKLSVTGLSNNDIIAVGLFYSWQNHLLLAWLQTWKDVKTAVWL